MESHCTTHTFPTRVLDLKTREIWENKIQTHITDAVVGTALERMSKVKWFNGMD